MNATSFVTSSLLTAALVLGGCGSKNKSNTDDPSGSSKAKAGETELAPKPKSKEVAKGDGREALLQLHRVHFALDSAELLAESRTALEEAATRLVSYPKVHIYIDGHTDDRGTTEYNLGLGDRRGHAVQDFLVKLGIEAGRLHVVTFGEEQPLSTGHSDAALAKNRRAEFRLMRGDVHLVVEDGALYDDKGGSMQDDDDSDDDM